jgi:hypothetical protein
VGEVKKVIYGWQGEPIGTIHGPDVTPEGSAPKRWTVRVCEDHQVQDCALCGVFDVLPVVPASALREAELLLRETKDEYREYQQAAQQKLAEAEKEITLLRSDLSGRSAGSCCDCVPGLKQKLAEAEAKLANLTRLVRMVKENALFDWQERAERYRKALEEIVEQDGYHESHCNCLGDVARAALGRE